MAKHTNSLDDLIALILSSKNKKLCTQLLEFFLTPEEKSDLELRVILIKALLEGKMTQRQIASEYNISIAKITRGSNELKRIDPKLLTYLKQHLTE